MTQLQCDRRLNTPNGQSSISNVVQRSKFINNIGVEMQSKATKVKKVTNETNLTTTEPGFHEHLVDQNLWHLEADRGEPETVSKTIRDGRTLANVINEMRNALRMIDANAQQAYNMWHDALNFKRRHDLATRDDRKAIFKGQIGRNLNELKDKMDDIGLPKNLAITEYDPNKQFLISPQLSFQVAKGRIGDLMSNVIDNNLITYPDDTQIYQKDATPYDRRQFNRINPDAWGSFKALEDDIAEEALKYRNVYQIKGVIQYWVMMLAFGSNTNIPDYYKSRFSLMPRTTLNSVMKNLNFFEKRKLKLISKEIAERYKNKLANQQNFGAPQFPEANGRKGLENFFNSAMGSGAMRQKKQLNGTKSFADFVTGAYPEPQRGNDINDGGYSLGALPLPDDADAVLEYRRMPYLKTNDQQSVMRAFITVIDSFDPG